jgi:hypothetical protein
LYICDYIAIKPGYIGKKLGVSFYAAGIKRVMELGAEGGYGRVSNPFSKRIFDAVLGFEMACSIPLAEKEF